MKVKILSVRNPISYLICAGIKDIENRTWTTKYRGELHIHSSGYNEYFEIDRQFDFYKLLPVHQEFHKLKYKDNVPFFKKESDIIGIDDEEKSFFLKNEAYRCEYELFKRASEKEIFYKTQAIIGKVDLVDIIKNSKSEWAFIGNYHWVLKNPVLFDKPILNIKGKLKIYEMEI